MQSGPSCFACLLGIIKQALGQKGKIGRSTGWCHQHARLKACYEWYANAHKKAQKGLLELDWPWRFLKVERRATTPVTLFMLHGQVRESP